MQYTIRQAIPTDIDILDSIHTENMKEYVETIYPWKPQLFRDKFDPDDYQVIEINNIIIDFMKTISSEAEIYLGEIQISKDFQNQGIGTSLIESVVQEARTNKKKLWLKVLKGNPAQKPYQRLGFTNLKESSTHLIMVI